MENRLVGCTPAQILALEPIIKAAVPRATNEREGKDMPETAYLLDVLLSFYGHALADVKHPKS